MPHPVIAREGWTRILLAIAVAMLVHALAGLWIALPFWIVALLVLQFFRDPPRAIPDLPGAIVSPAHGRVVAIQPSVDPFSGEPSTRVSIFMNIFSVHSNRIPIDGEILDRQYHQGQFLNAELEKASSQNERCAIRIKSNDGSVVSCVQIAGLVARRILTYVQVGDKVSRGERYGFIRFGSRVDVYLPPDSEIVAKAGKWVLSGTDIIARLRKNSAQHV
ncbi:MAG TPA: phosphatidylserine decarboxylase family protein [Gammaproteobacteria bacterium]|jgi:phosphatidylserine decarboxylase|nr:MAG: phosphatidylserine decarboxylase family protein [Candidatus Thioglobus sp. MED-G23]RPG01623.1 MAG: phosphatidylserine decarboxylase [Proteobacteria bacterium TMED51]HAU42824.1 phosphatidylserine decarboxylase family protein [Gammaproteobacteria bacterium]HBP85306.1 phosphatidylserine decarboxylase family protein [Gammaproteobacteria bacterium]HCL94370.1 phosphatidylserine decarboxylase family protein [Gammaproteobacteria bacterium]|tara:strand:- start:9411 stop:10067 length:657 start_codon:yes stop_codon:yes gene_type:complete